MANFFTDNEDIEFYLNDPRLKRIVELREKGYTENETYPFAPENFEDAQDNFRRVLSIVGEISAETLAPAASEIDVDGCTLENNKVAYAPGAQEAMKRFGQADLFGFTLPREYGGLNFPMTIYMMAIEMVSRADASFMTLFGLQEISETILEFASPELKDEYLPKLSSGEYTGAMVLTEPEAGSDLQAIGLKASYDEKQDCWFLNGVKHFITNGCGDVLLVLARSEDNVQGGRGLSLFLCEKGDTVLVRRLENKLGIRGSPTCELQFKNCRAHLVGRRKRGLTRYVMQLMNGARLAIGAQSIGIAQAAYIQALEYAKQRKQFDKAIIEFPAVFDMLANMRVQIEAARSLLYEASIIVDQLQGLERHGPEDKETAKESKELKRFANLLTPMVKYYMKDYEVERIYRDARITTIYEGTSQLQVIGAVGGVTSGLFFKMLEGKKKDKYPKSLESLGAKIEEGKKRLADAVGFIKEQNDHFCTDYHARGLVDIAVETLMGVLLLEGASKSEHKVHVAKKFVADSHPRIQMLAARIMAGDIDAINEFRG
ncbi:MAG: acyl-CoA dehydrogenase family protein, partial [Deltaproteobacteria bacterium]|nr:acyl-CoA dehydrogenase family protein [Deltaproteobacteria bacterium]